MVHRTGREATTAVAAATSEGGRVRRRYCDRREFGQRDAPNQGRYISSGEFGVAFGCAWTNLRFDVLEPFVEIFAYTGSAWFERISGLEF
jgi:hypothetical protein